MSSRNTLSITNWYRWLVVGVLIFIVYCFFLYFIVQKYVFAPLNEFAHFIESLSFSKQNSIRKDLVDPFERANCGIDSFLAKIEVVTEGLSEAIDAMATTCSQMEQLSKASESSVSTSEKSVEATKHSLNEIRNTLSFSLKRMKDIVKLATKTDKEASLGYVEILRVIDSIKMVNKSTSVLALSRLIGTLADNANSIALKTAIEAARDNSSNSLALVAQETRGLSTKLQEVSREIDSIVSVNSITLADSTKLADNAAEKLNSIVKGIEGTAGLISHIFEDIGLWNSLIDNVQRDVIELDKAVKENAVAVNRSKVATSDLLGKTVTVSRTLDELSINK